MYALKMKEENIAVEDGKYGLIYDDTLIPETVKVGDLEFGRFEITRQQYKAFDPEYAFTPGTGNYPASGVSFERAKDYCEWLSNKTGNTYRLPTVDEMDALIKKANGNANNLDYWAGYSVNPEDEKLLQEELAKLGPDALLMAGGSMGPSIETSLFDIKGNAAEWCTLEDGSARACGGCATLADDTSGKGKTPPAEFASFRIVRQ
jgi:formylglycine-generating enzyme required for sulfatase activity